MNDTKQWWQSKAIWGSLISIVAVGVGFTGHQISAADQQVLVDAVSTVIATGGQVYAIYGRMVASSKIGG